MGSTPPPRASVRPVVEDLARALTLAAVLLPVAGVLTRFAAFASSTTGTTSQPLGFALAATPSELIASGAGALFTIWVLAVVVFVSTKLATASDLRSEFEEVRQELDRVGAQVRACPSAVADPKGPTGDELREVGEAIRNLETRVRELTTAQSTLGRGLARRRLRDAMTPPRFTPVVATVVLVSSVLVWLFLPDFPGLPISVETVLLGYVFIPWGARQVGRWHWSRTLPFIVVATVAAAVGLGLEGSIVDDPGGVYHFSPSVAQSSGRYVEIAESGSLVYLLPCGVGTTSQNNVVAVDRQNILSIDINAFRPSSPWPSLFQSFRPSTSDSTESNICWRTCRSLASPRRRPTNPIPA